MKKQQITALAIGALLILGVAAFAINSGDDDVADSDSTASETSQSSNINLPFDFEVTNLETLQEGVYEGWVVRGDDRISFGTFNTDENGEIVGDLELAEDIDPQDGDTVAISIEPVPDADPGPSSTIILAGELSDGSTELALPFADDVAEYAGTYFLATPSDDDDTNETAGVWFINTESGEPAQGLQIPVAPEGWAYEGWILYNGTPYSTGQFTDPGAVDEFSDFTGPNDVPPYPGEDFVMNLPDSITDLPVDLANGTSSVVLSLEPRYNGEDPTGPSPAQIKPLAAEVAEGAEDHTTFDLGLDLSSLPSGSASIN